MMDAVLKRIAWCAALAAVLSSPAAADEAGDGEESEKRDWFMPIWRSMARGGVSDYSLGTGMKLKFDPGRNWLITSDLNIEYKTYRGQDAEEVRETFMNNATKIMPGNYSINLSIGEIYSKKKTFGLERSGQDLVFDDESANLDLVVQRSLLKASSGQVSAKGRAARGINDFKYDKNIACGAGVFLRYDLGDNIQIKGGVGTRRKRETSEVGTVVFKGMPSHSDTFRVGAAFGSGDEKLLEVYYDRSKGIDREVALPAGNSLARVFDPENAKLEEAHKENEEIVLNSYLELFPYLALRVAFDHKSRSQNNIVDTRLSRANESTNLTATVLYDYSSRGTMSFDILTSDGTVDYGPVSTSNFDERTYQVNAKFSFSFNDSLRLYVGGTSSMKQKFFQKKDINKRDADYLNYKANVILDAGLLPSLAAKVDFTVGRYETINIDKSLSGSNKYDWHYTVKPSFVFKPATWVSIQQVYMIKIDFKDFIYREEDNYLDRNTALETRADFGVTEHVRFGFKHNYLLRDSGSYLLKGNERFYTRTGETRQHDLRLSVEYMPVKDFSVGAVTKFRHQVFSRLGEVGGRRSVISSDVYDTGGLRLGFMRRKKISENGQLNLDVYYVRGFGKSLSSLRRKYWEVEASLAFNF